MSERAPEVRWTTRTVPLAAGPVAGWIDRAVASGFVASAVVMTFLLARATPDPRGHATHEQLGLEPCGWPMHYGFPCPTCGCTTAACCVVHGRLIDAFVVQPFGATVAIVGLALAAHALWCLVRGRSFVDLLVVMPYGRVVLGGFVLLAAAWGYKCAVFAP